MTDFAWDQVHLFDEGTEYRYIDDVVGTEVFDRGGRFRQPGTLLVFTLRGKLVHAVAVIAPLYVEGCRHSYRRESTLVQARSRDPGPYVLDLVTRQESARPAWRRCRPVRASAGLTARGARPRTPAVAWSPGR